MLWLLRAEGDNGSNWAAARFYPMTGPRRTARLAHGDRLRVGWHRDLRLQFVGSESHDEVDGSFTGE